MNTWRVWITGYPNGYETVDVDARAARPSMAAINIVARRFRAHHHNEIIEVNASLVGSTLTFAYFCRFSRDGSVEWL